MAMSKQKDSEPIEEPEFGPCVMALNDRQRKFVMAALASPDSNPTDWARLAGYKDRGKPYSNIRVTAHGLMHAPKIEAALVELARTSFTTGGVALAASNLLRIARDQKHPRRYDASVAILNRSGLHEKSEHTLRVQRDNSVDMEQLAIRLAAELGIPAEQLIGWNKMIDVTPTTSTTSTRAEVEVGTKPEPDDPLAEGVTQVPATL
jgi:hypothetical protein